MSKFASSTSVSPEKSRLEIETVLKRYGATHFAYATSIEKSMIMFDASDRRIRFMLPMPTVQSFKKFRRNGSSCEYRRTDSQAKEMHAQAVRQRWRALALAIKAKLEAVESRIATFEEEFMAQIVLPNGQTLSEHALPFVQKAYDEKSMPPLLTLNAT